MPFCRSCCDCLSHISHFSIPVRFDNLAVRPYVGKSGQRRQKSDSTGLPVKGNKRRAQQMLDNRLKELAQQYEPFLDDGRVLFLDFMRDWLDNVMAYKVKENTLEQYNLTFDRYISEHKPFHGLKLQDLTPPLLQSYYSEQVKAGLSPNTMRKHHANIHKCLNHAVRLGLIAFNPSAQVELPAKQKYTGATACTPEQLQDLLQLFRGDPLETVLMLGITYGLRRSEVCGLRWDAVDMEAGTLHICHTAVKANGRVLYSDSTKTSTSNRVLPLTASMREYLGSVRERQEENKRLFGRDYTDSGYICVKPDGTPIDPDFVTHHFRRVLVANDVPVIRFHDLRHSAVNTLRKGGCDVKDIQAWLGHSDVSTTLNIYSHILQGDMARLGNVADAALFQAPKAG